MRFPSRLWLLICALSLAAPARAADRVVIIVLDGLRATEGFDDPDHRFIPHMALELAPQGALARACDNNGYTLTIPGHAAIGSGRYQNLPDDGSVRSLFPLLWEYYRDQTGQAQRTTAIPTTKNKIECLSYSTWATYGPPDSARVIGPTWDDTVTTTEFLTDMVTSQPVISLLNFGSIDMGGHTGSWEDYTRQISVADSCVAVIWERIQSDPIFSGRTDLIVTGDHGRHSDQYGAWSLHGDGCPGCRRIPLLALGPDFRVGQVSWTACEQIDLCKTIATALGISAPYAGGRVLTELLQTPAEVADEGPLPSVRVTVDGSRARFLSFRPDGPVRLSIHDITGRRLADGIASPEHPWSWDGGGPGIYFYRAGRESGRFLILR